MNFTDPKIVEEKYAKLITGIESSKKGQWLFNPLENDLQWDKDMYALFDVNPADFSGAYEAWMSCLHPEDVETAPKDFEKALLGTGDFEAVFRILTKDKEIRFIGARGKIDRDENGGPLFVTGVNWDCTEEHKQGAAS